MLAIENIGWCRCTQERLDTAFNTKCSQCLHGMQTIQSRTFCVCYLWYLWLYVTVVHNVHYSSCWVFHFNFHFLYMNSKWYTNFEIPNCMNHVPTICEKYKQILSVIRKKHKIIEHNDPVNTASSKENWNTNRRWLSSGMLHGVVW
jgi:hypothetical protein